MSKQNAQIVFTNNDSLTLEGIKDVTVNPHGMGFTLDSGNSATINTDNVNYVYFYSMED